MQALAVIGSFVILLGWLRSYIGARRLLSRAKGTEVSIGNAGREPDMLPTVSVLLPARNEEKSLDACLSSLRAQDYPALEIVVVDDRSTDRTAQILARHAREDSRIVPLQGAEPPSGWFGKPNALHLAAEHASGAWLLATDADTEHTPMSVRAGVVYALNRELDALSLVPKLEYRTLTAHLLYPQLTAFFGAIRATHERSERASIPMAASGGWFLIKRSVWDRIGGISRVRSEIAEDLALARAVVAEGFRYRFAAGPALWSTPAYSTLRELYDGYARNPVFSLGGKLSRAIAVVLVSCIGALLPLATALLCGIDISTRLSRGQPPSLLSIIGLLPYFGALLLQASLRTRLRTHAWMSVLSPVSAVAGSMLVFLLFRRARRGQALSWKGRTYSV